MPRSEFLKQPNTVKRPVRTASYSFRARSKKYFSAHGAEDLGTKEAGDTQRGGVKDEYAGEDENSGEVAALVDDAFVVTERNRETACQDTEAVGMYEASRLLPEVVPARGHFVAGILQQIYPALLFQGIEDS